MNATTLVVLAALVGGVVLLTRRSSSSDASAPREGQDGGPCRCTPAVFAERTSRDGRPAGYYLRRGDCVAVRIPPPIGNVHDKLVAAARAHCSSFNDPLDEAARRGAELAAAGGPSLTQRASR